MPRKAFIFDMDGVLIDSERVWEAPEPNFLSKVFGHDIATKIGSPIGLSSAAVLEKAHELGSDISADSYYEHHDAFATHVYEVAPMTAGLEELGELLKAQGYNLAIVSASRHRWIDLVLPRISFKDDIAHVISLAERPDLRHKPHPDGYQEAMRLLKASHEHTIILEDSNLGLAAAKAAGAYVIGLRANLVPGYQQEGADVYADTLEDVIRIVNERN